jgi:dihydroxy-acid dehydratase
MKYVGESRPDLLNLDVLTCTGRTLRENLANVPSLTFDHQDVIRPLENPIKETGVSRVLCLRQGRR